MEKSNITFNLIKNAEATPTAPAVLLPDREINYKELNELTWKSAQYLHDHGVRAGDVVAMTFESELWELIAILAVARLGATVLSLPTSLTDYIRAETVKMTNARCLVSDAPEINDYGLLKHILDPDSINSSSSAINYALAKGEPDAPFVIVIGSGSTGRPKRFAISHKVFLDRMVRRQEAFGIVRSDRFARLSSIAYVGSKLRYLTVLMAGAAIVLWDHRREDLLTACRKYKVSFLSGVVVQIENTLRSLPANSNQVLGFLRVLELSASTVTQSLRERVVRYLCPNLYITYSSNEFGASNIAKPGEVLSVPGTVGKTLKGVEVLVTDEKGVTVPVGEIGLLRMRTHCMIDGYIEDDQATKQAFKEGWFLPGDLAKFTPEGDLVYYGRADHMMIMNGINIFPLEIEQALASHPAVLDAAVMPVKHEVHQDIPICAVATDSKSGLSEQELLAYARERLGTRSPHRVLIVDSIPRNEQGKLIRTELAARIAEKLRLAVTQRNTSVNKPPMQVSGNHPSRIVFAFIPSNQDSLVQLDAWLCGVLNIEVDPFSIKDNLASVWLRRCLLLSRVLFQASRIPIFNEPRVISLQRKKGDEIQWQAVVDFPLIDGLPHHAYKMVLIESFNLSTWAALHPINDDNRNIFYSEIKKRVISQLMGMLPTGKSTLPVLRVAYANGIPFIHLGGGVFQLGWGNKARRMDRSGTELDSAMGSRLSQSKVLTARLLRMAGFPAPEHKVVTKTDTAINAAQSIGFPVVVKPVDCERGEGVTVDVTDEETLIRAFETAVKLSHTKQAIVERQVEGVCHRLFIANGKLLYAVKRLPMSVKGNGKQTVAELVVKEYEAEQRKPPWSRTEIRLLDELALNAMAAAGFTEFSVPDDGVFVPLRKIESTEWGGVDEEVTNSIHPENIRLALEATILFSLQVAGIDIISSDISKPWYDNGAVINEVNFSPLLGGGEISRRHIPTFIKALIDGNGRIPVEVFVGGDTAWRVAFQRWQAMLSDGMNAYLTNEVQTLVPSGEPWIMPFRSAYLRTRALVLSPKVECIVLVVQTDEFLYSGLPIEAADVVTNIDEQLVSYKQAGGQIPAKQFSALARLLKGWERSN